MKSEHTDITNLLLDTYYYDYLRNTASGFEIQIRSFSKSEDARGEDNRFLCRQGGVAFGGKIRCPKKGKPGQASRRGTTAEGCFRCIRKCHVPAVARGLSSLGFAGDIRLRMSVTQFDGISAPLCRCVGMPVSPGGHIQPPSRLHANYL